MIEVIAQNIEDASVIESCGAHRIELVSRMDLDGLTPSLLLLENIKSKIKIPVRVMIRPHDLGFEYTKTEIKNMMDTMNSFINSGADGLVIGCLHQNQLALNELEALIKHVKVPITFHRAIDVTRDPIHSYRILQDFQGIDQILTSGGIGKAKDNLESIKEMYGINSDKLLVGSGIQLDQIQGLKALFPKANIHVGSGVRESYGFDRKIDENILIQMVKTHMAT